MSSQRRRTKDVAAQALPVLAIALAFVQVVTCGPTQELERLIEEPAAARRPIFFSELKLRAVIEDTNLELRELKRDFMRQMSDVYLGLKLDPSVGFEVARGGSDQGAPVSRSRQALASANILLGEEFASMVIKKHIAQRRLLTGLKMAFVKLLPMGTLVNLYRRHRSAYEWLRDQQQVDLRPKFVGARENQFVILYTLIELRARLRTADDVFALTSDSARRILQIVQHYLIESRHGPEVEGAQLAALARNAKQVLEYYADEMLAWREGLHAKYAAFFRNAEPLAHLLEGGGGTRALIEFIDRLINIEALDIDLSAEAAQLELPPTITDDMIANVQKRWLPWYVLKSLEEDRRLLVNTTRKQVMHLVRLDPAKQDADLAEWSSNLLGYICRNSVTYY